MRLRGMGIFCGLGVLAACAASSDDGGRSKGGSGGSTGGACTADARMSCACPGGTMQGITTCLSTGTWGACSPCVGGAGGSGAVGGTGGVAGSAGSAGVGGTAGVAGSAGAAGVAGTSTGGVECTAPETCQSSPAGNYCALGQLPASCTMVGMACGPNMAGQCMDAAAFGFAGMNFCITPCRP